MVRLSKVSLILTSVGFWLAGSLPFWPWARCGTAAASVAPNIVRRLIVGSLIVMDMLRIVGMEPLLYQLVYLG
jgi:hypothetical protein